MSRARDFQEQRRRSKTLFHHGFFGKYTIPKDRERRRSKRNPAASVNHTRSTATNSVSSIGSTTLTSSATSGSTTPTSALRSISGTTLSSFEDVYDTPRSPPLLHEQLIQNLSSLQDDASSASLRRLPDETKPVIESDDSISNALPRSSSSVLSPPPTDPSSIGSFGSSSSRKRKRASGLNRQSSSTSPPQSQDDTLHPPINPRMSPKYRHPASPPTRGTSTSSISVLSTTPVPPDNLSEDEGLAHEGTDTVPTSSLTSLSATPRPPEDFQRHENVGDSQESEELSEDGVFEEEKEPVLSNSTAVGFCVNDDSDSDSDLPSLEQLIPRKPPKSRGQSLGVTRSGPSPRTSQRATPSRSKTLQQDLKYSLKQLLTQNQKDEKRVMQIEDAQAQLDALEAAEESEAQALAASASGTEMLAAVDDEQSTTEDGLSRRERVELAIKRQEMITHDTAWHFFDHSLAIEKVRIPDFPVKSLADNDLCRLSDPAFREYAFLSGFACDYISGCADVPEEFFEWLWYVALYEPRDELRVSYAAAVRASSHRMNIDREKLNEPLRRMGTTEEAFSVGQPLKHVKQSIKDGSLKTPHYLLSFLQVLACVSDSLPTDEVSKMICLLLRLGIDRSASDDFEVLSLLRSLLLTLIDALPVELPSQSYTDLVEGILKPITNPTLQRKLLWVMPDTSQESLLLRRRLALSFFCQSYVFIKDPLTDAEAITSQIKHRIETGSAFDPTDERIDYRSLAALVSILDAAIGPGFGQLLKLSCGSNSEELKEYSQREKSFNRQVDALSFTVNGLYTSIQDTGASHMLRTTAKSSVQNLQFRLDYAVRTKPRPRKDILAATLGTRSKVRFGVDKTRRRSDEGHHKKKQRFALAVADYARGSQQGHQTGIMKKFLEPKGKKPLPSKSPLSTEVDQI